MKFRTRLLIAFGAVVMIPLLVFGLGIRREMSNRIRDAYQQRVASQMRVFRNDLQEESNRILSRLGGLWSAMLMDSRLRGALVRGENRDYLLDYAGNAMQLAGLDFLQIVDDEGRVLSSGHFRNEFDRVAPHVVGVMLVRARTAEGSFIALATRRVEEVAGRRITFVGGARVDSAFLARLVRDPEFQATLSLPADSSAANLPVDSIGTSANSLTLPYLNVDEPGTVGQARIIVTHSPDLLAELQRNVNLWFIVAFLIAALSALLLAGWLSTRISEPVEARIAIGDIARQVNHDIKNGLAPLRNVFRHLTQVARDTPAELPQVFAERQGTVESSISYLETLAANYAKLSPQSERKATDVNTVVRETIGASGSVRTKLAEGLPPVSADALVLRRVIENLVSNAVDSLDGKTGTVTVTTESGKNVVRISVSDTGRGMSKSELDKAFDDFHTTKPGGTGLGLSIVRRLVLDSNGSLKVETEPGQGSTFIVEIPILS